jgi:hypothetical protein
VVVIGEKVRDRSILSLDQNEHCIARALAEPSVNLFTLKWLA